MTETKNRLISILGTEIQHISKNVLGIIVEYCDQRKKINMCKNDQLEARGAIRKDPFPMYKICLSYPFDEVKLRYDRE